MRDQLKFRFICLILLVVFTCGTGFQKLYAQDAKKNKVRLNVTYVKIMDGEIFFDIKASSRIDKKNTTVSNIKLTVFNIIDDEKITVGETTTNSKGLSRFTLDNINAIRSDTSNTYNILVSFNGNDKFNKAKKNISFKDVMITAKIITKDTINYVHATLVDSSTKNPLSNESLTVQVQRLFQPLFIGEEFNVTDESGKIVVPIEEGIPGIDRNLTIEVVLFDSENYGTVKAIVTAPVGSLIVDESTFDQRKMWSPRDKTPIFLLIFPNLIIFGMWFIIVYLSLNLLKISKS
jgi:hypothetical protein